VTIVSIRDQIKAADDGSADLYEIPEWEVVVEVRSMTARSRAKFVADIASADGTITANDPDRIESMWWHAISQSCFDPDSGERVFDDGDADWLFGEKNARVVNDLANTCMAISGLTEDAAGDAGKDFSDSLTDEADETLSDASTSD
jgi:hypothetical protein